MTEVKWIKIVTDIFDDEKILLIEGMPEADSIIVIWFKLLCLAGKQNNSGVFLMSNRIPYTDEMLATIFRRKLTTVKLALQTFEQFGMIEIINNVITIPNWSKHQSLEQLENRKEYMRGYMQNYRNKQRQKANGEIPLLEEDLGNFNTNIEDEINDIKEKNKDYPSIKQQIEEFTQDEELRETLNQFVLMREKIRKKLTNYAFYRLLCKLSKQSANKNDQIAILNQSIENSWQDIFPLRESFKNTKKKTTLPDWYEQYEKDLKVKSNKEEKEMTQEELDEVAKKI